MEYFKFIEDKLHILDHLGPLISRAEVVGIELDGPLSFAMQRVGGHSYSFHYDTKAERDEYYNVMYQWLYGKSSSVSKEIDWEQRRYELSKDILARRHFPYDVYNSCLQSSATATEAMAKASVMMADALISELKKKQ